MPKKRTPPRAKGQNRTKSKNRASPGAVDPLAMTPTEAAQLLSAAGGVQIPVEWIQADIAAGAPTQGGRLNLVQYAAWLARESM